VDRVSQGHTGEPLVQHVVGKVATMPAVEEAPDRFERLAGGVGDGGHRDRPGGFGLLVQAAGEAPVLYVEDRLKAWG